MFRRKNANPIKAAEGEVYRLRQRRDDLAARLRDAEAAAEVAVRAQREALVADDIDGPVVKRVEEECLRACFRRDAFRDALDETEGQLAEAETKLAADQDRAEREKVASDLLERAAEIDADAARFVEAAAALARVHVAFIEVIRSKGIRSPIYPGLDRPAEQVAFNVLHGAVSTLPVQVSVKHPDAPPARDVGEVIAEVMTDRMRALAEAIRSGEAAVSESLPAPLPDVQPMVTITTTRVALREAVQWNGSGGRLVQVLEGAADLPAPAAEKAFALGIAVPIDAPEASAIVAEAAGPDIAPGSKNWRPTQVRRGPPFRNLEINLGDNLAEHVAQERQRIATRFAA